MTCPKCFEAETEVVATGDHLAVECTSDDCDFRHTEDPEEAAEKRRDQQAERDRVQSEMEGHLSGLRKYIGRVRGRGDDR